LDAPGLENDLKPSK